MRLAYLSPLPPRKSGISDYSAELLPHLASHFDVHPFSDEAGTVGGLTVRPYAEFAALASSGHFDAIVYQLGNNADYHARIHQLLLEYPGIVVLHEYMLHHLIQERTLSRGDLAGYLEELRYCYGDTGRDQAQRALDTGIPIDRWSYPLFERVIDRSLGAIVHNETTRRRVLASRPLAHVATVPHHLALDALPADRGAARRHFRSQWSIPDDAFVVATFGFITPHKRIEVALRAFAQLRQRYPKAMFVMAGEVSPFYDIQGALGELGDSVLATGRLDLPDLLSAMASCDVAVNLRYPTGGETSGTSIRLLGLGTATIVSNSGSFAEIPDGCCAKVDLDEREEAVLAAYLERFASEPELGRRMGENARRHMTEHHTLKGSARGYREFVEEIAASGVEPFPAVPPLARSESVNTPAELIAGVSSTVVDLGLDERDEDVMRHVAGRIVELGFDHLGSN